MKKNLFNLKALSFVSLMTFIGGGNVLAGEIAEGGSISTVNETKTSVTISPATGTFKKAPVTVTITAPEGAFVVYTTDDASNDILQYKGPFQITKSGTLVKVSAFTTTGRISTNATYTIVPDQPVFSAESKTFEDAFDVTLSLPATTDASSAIHYAIGEKATVESPVYTQPVAISANHDGDKVELHAVVVDEYGNVGEEKTCTYTFSKNASLAFKAQDIDGSYYATFSAAEDVVFPKDVVVYAVSVKDGKAVKTALKTDYYEVTNTTVGEGTGIVDDGYYVPANTGVLVMSLAPSVPYYFPQEAQTTTLPDNQLKAAIEGGVFTAEVGNKYYKLAYGDYAAKTGLGFYWGADNGAAFNVKAGTAYLAVPATETLEAKGYSFSGETTGINNLNANGNKAKAIYNVNGQRVETPSQTGLYIVDGKKVVIRK